MPSRFGLWSSTAASRFLGSKRLARRSFFIIAKLHEALQREGYLDQNKSLYAELRSMCLEGEPFLIVRNLVNGAQGAEAWRKLNLRFRPRGEARAETIEDLLREVRWPEAEDD